MSDRKGREKPTNWSRMRSLTLGTLQRSSCHQNLKIKDKKSFHLLSTCSPQVTDHMEYHVNMEMRRTTCQKLETTNCMFQEGELYKVLGECTLTQKEVTGIFCAFRMSWGRIIGDILKLT